MERCNAFKCAMAFLCGSFIIIFICLCLASCEYEKAITPDKEFVKVGISLSNTTGTTGTQATTDTTKWHEE